MLRRLIVIIVAVALGATTARAQKTGPHGGLVGNKGDHQTELVVTPSELIVYMLHDGKPHDAKGVSLRAVVQQSGQSRTVELVADGGKRLVGKLDAPLAKGAIVVLTGKDDHGNAVSARYAIN